MSEKLKNIEAQIHTLSSTISDGEAAIIEKDLPFLQVIWFQSVKWLTNPVVRVKEGLRPLWCFYTSMTLCRSIKKKIFCNSYSNFIYLNMQYKYTQCVFKSSMLCQVK